MKILHIVPGLNDPTCGIAVAAKLIAEGQRREGHEVELVDTKEFVKSILLPSTFSLLPFSEIWVHSMWLPITLLSCWRVLKCKRGVGVGVRCTKEDDQFHSSASTSNCTPPLLIRMPHGCLDPVKIRYSYWKKFFVIPLEKYLFRHCDRIVATERDEVNWIQSFVQPSNKLKHPLFDFDSQLELNHSTLQLQLSTSTLQIQLHDLGSTIHFTPRPGLEKRKFIFVGRLHPLKGLNFLISAIGELHTEKALPPDFSLTVIGRDDSGLRAEYEQSAQGLPIHFLGEVDAETKQREMSSVDFLILPTLSENFGLVVAESLQLGVPVITTDGASAWEPKEKEEGRGKKEEVRNGLIYLRGYRDGSERQRIDLLKDALKQN